MDGKIYRAGLLPYIQEDNTIRFLFMKPADSRYGGECFQIAKGKIEEGETDEDAAIREAEEELGVVQSNLGPIVFLGTYLGRTSIFIAPVKDKTLFTAPHFETGETAWMDLVEFDMVGRDLHIPILQDAVRHIYRTRM